MKKSDLIPGKHVVEMQKGKRYLVMDGFLTWEHGFLPLNKFDDGLRHQCFSSFDIVRVFKVSLARPVESILKPNLHDIMVWEREKPANQQEQAHSKLRELEHKQRQLAEEISKVREDLA